MNGTKEIIDLKKVRRSKKDTYLNGLLFMTAEERERLFGFYDSIQKSAEKVADGIRSTVKFYYSAGEMLTAKIMDMDAGKTKDTDIAEALGMPVPMVTKALKVYRRFAGNCKALDSMTMAEALGLVIDRKAPKGISGKDYTYAENGQQELFNPEELFSHPPISGAPLERYRVFSDANSRFYITERGNRNAIVVGSLMVSQMNDSETQVAYKDMMNDIQGAVEKYYAVVEQVETVGNAGGAE